MNIWIAVHHFPPKYTGGAEWRAYRTAKAIQHNGHHVRVMCIEHIDRPETNNLSWTDDIFDEIPVRRIDFNLAKAEDPFRLKYNNNWIRDAMSEWMDENKPDLLHLISGYLMTASPLLLAFQNHIPTVVTLTDFWFLCPRINMLRTDGKLATFPIQAVDCVRCMGEEKRRFRWLGKIIPRIMSSYWGKQTKKIDQMKNRMKFLIETLNQVDLIISPSTFLRSVYLQSGIDPEKITFLRQGVDLSEVLFVEKPSRQKTLRIGYLGQIAPHKGVHLLIDAIKKLPGLDIAVEIFGKTSNFPAYAAKLAKMVDHDQRVHLKGNYLGPQALNSVMAELDCVVVPSVWFENSPNSILESFAYRTPVIVSNIGGMAELVQHRKNGLLFNMGDSTDLAGKIKSLVDEPDLLHQLREGIQPVKNITTEMEELLEIYRKEISAKRNFSLVG